MKHTFQITAATVLVASAATFALISTQAAVASPAVAQASLQAASPDAFVKKVADALVDKLKTQRTAYKKNPAILTDIVHQNIEPYVDFDGFARGVMGKYANQATAAQRTQFTQTFKANLLKTYTNSLAAFDNESYTIRPVASANTSNKAIVTMDFKTDKGTVIPVTYQLVKDTSSNWKVRNLQLNGIDVGLSFKNEFSANVQKNKGDLDAAIKTFVPSDANAPKK